MNCLLPICHLHEPMRTEHPAIEVLEEIEVDTCSLQLVQSPVGLPLPLYLTQRNTHWRDGAKIYSHTFQEKHRIVISFRGLRERVRAALSSSGSLLFRLNSSVLSIRRSRADGLGLPDPTPSIPQLLQALHSRREFLPTAKEKNKSGRWPTENLNDAIAPVL